MITAGQSEVIYKMGRECAPMFSLNASISLGHEGEQWLVISPKLIVALLET